jgi:GT2 family glycosyltransferase
MKLGFVFTNFNNSSFTRLAVVSIMSVTDTKSASIVIVDNCSARSDVDELLKLKLDFPVIDLILNNENIGYFRGLNQGIKLLREAPSMPTYIVVGNNDLEFPENFSDSLQAKADVLNRYAVVSPDLITLDGVHQNPHVERRISKLREFIWDIYFMNYGLARAILFFARLTRRFTERKDYERHHIAQSIYQGYGACYILGPKFFENFEELWAPTFLMGEEVFLSIQLSRKGLSVFYEPSICVRHHDHATLDKVPGRKLWQISRDAHRVYRRYVKVFPWQRPQD